MTEKQSNNKMPLYIIIGILMLLFVIPFVLVLITLIAYGEFRLPSELGLSAVMMELDANFVLAMLITVLPLLMVWAVEASRRRGKRSVGLTLGLLIALMVGVTAVPVIAYLKPLAAVPTGQAIAILSMVALPLLLVILLVAILLPGMLRADEKETVEE